MDIETLAKRYTGSRAKRYEEQRVGSAKWKREQGTVETMLARLERGAKVLDVPVGTGRFIESYKRFELRATGVDASSDMLEEARKKASALDCDIALEQGSIFGLDFEDGCFDAVVCTRFLNWVAGEELAVAIGELARVTREHLIIGVREFVPLRDMAVYTPAGCVRLARQCLARLRGSGEAGLAVHRRHLLGSLFGRFRLDVAEAQRVEARVDGTEYVVYLLRRRPERGGA